MSARIVNTTSGPELWGNVGQANYSAAKAAIAAFGRHRPGDGALRRDRELHLAVRRDPNTGHRSDRGEGGRLEPPRSRRTLHRSLPGCAGNKPVGTRVRPFASMVA
jgi:hypothetical protein